MSDEFRRKRKLTKRSNIHRLFGWANRIRTKACTLYASLLADEKRERNCVALEAVSSRPEIQCRGEGAPVVIPARFTEDVRADFRAQNRLDFRRLVRIGYDNVTKPIRDFALAHPTDNCPPSVWPLMVAKAPMTPAMQSILCKARSS
jgi:hypothetical protein